MNGLVKKIFRYYFNLIKLNRNWIFIIFLLFIISAISGSFFALKISSFSKNILQRYIESIGLEPKQGLDLSFYIFQRNISIISIGTLGAFFFGITAVFITIINGFLLGVVLSFREIYSVISPIQLLLLLLPHGIIEYTASFLALGFGLRLGLNWIFSKQKNRWDVFLRNLKETLAILVLVTFLLVFAALVEGLLTEKIACWVGRLCR